MKTQLFITFATLEFPTRVGLTVLEDKFVNIGLGLAIMGIVCMLLAIWSA